MFCRFCGKPIEDGAYCPSCGQSQITRISNENTQWYYLIGSDSQGPLDYKEISELISKSVISRETLVWTNGLSTWTPAEQSGLFPLFSSVVPTLPATLIPEKWVWALATWPIVISWFFPWLLPLFGINLAENFWLAAVIVMLINCIFMALDLRVLSKSKIDLEKSLYLGFVLVPIYLVVRARITNKNYMPVIVWCVLFAIDMFGWI